MKGTLLLIATVMVTSSATGLAQPLGPGIASFGDKDGVVAAVVPEPAPATLAPVAAVRQPAARPIMRSELGRPKALSVLYVSLGVTQALDVMTTTNALQAGGREQNPVLEPFAGNTGAMIAYKAAMTAGTIVAIERVWKKNRAAAIATAVAVNVVTAAVAAHNARVMRAQRVR